MNIITTGLRFKTTQHGQGRHIKDPSISKPYDVLQYSYYLWISQVINLIAVAVLKYSICAYLLALKFSRVYLGIVWASILMVTVFNLVIPTLNVFCRTPFEANWNKSVHGTCFVKGGLGVVYTQVRRRVISVYLTRQDGPLIKLNIQGVSNIITDVVYVVAPILYLSTIRLPRRTQWGLRIVFCLGIV